MKTINISFDDETYERLIEAKSELSWRSFIIKSCLIKEEEIKED